VSFRRALIGDKLRLWYELVSKILNMVLTEDKDSFLLSLNTNSVLRVKSMYTDLMQADRVPTRGIVWKLKVLLKIKIFLLVLTKRNYFNKG
jgi:hypothetical protein